MNLFKFHAVLIITLFAFAIGCGGKEKRGSDTDQETAEPDATPEVIPDAVSGQPGGSIIPVVGGTPAVPPSTVAVTPPPSETANPLTEDETFDERVYTHFSLIPGADENLKTYSGYDALLGFRPDALQNSVVFRKKEATPDGGACENYIEASVIVGFPKTQDLWKLADVGFFLRYCNGPASECPIEQTSVGTVREMEIQIRDPEIEDHDPARFSLCPEYSQTCYVLFHQKWDFDCDHGEDVAQTLAERYLVTVVPRPSALDGNECECHHPDAAGFSDDSNINPSCLGGGGIECPDPNHPFCVGTAGGTRAGRCSSVVVRDYLEVETPASLSN